MSIIPNQPLEINSEDTYECSTCGRSILASNQFTHDAICARMNAGGNQRQAQPQGQIIRRGSSSSGLPEPSEPTYNNRRPQVREERNIVNNKLVTCPNCGNSVREQSLNSHLNNECASNDKIPCEFCNQSIPMSSYTHHIEDVHRREREEEQERHNQRHQQEEQAPREPRQRSNERSNQNVRPNVQPQSMSEESSPSNEPEQQNSGGFMGFLRGLLHTATQNRSEPVQEERPREVERHLPSEQPQSGSRSLLSRLLGIPHDHEHEHGHEERSRPMTMEDFFIQSLQNREEAQRAQQREREAMNPFMGSHRHQNPFVSQPSGNRSMRTIRLGPNGTLIISSGRGQVEEEPEDVWQSVGVPQRRRQQQESNMGPMSMGEMGPMGLILQMLAARGQGMPVPVNFSQEQMNEIERGLSKEDIESLSIVKYDAAKNKNLSEDMKSCPICLDDFEDGVEIKFLWCLHRFHRKCIDQWLEKNTNCPICKKDFSEINQEFSE